MISPVTSTGKYNHSRVLPVITRWNILQNINKAETLESQKTPFNAPYGRAARIRLWVFRMKELKWYCSIILCHLTWLRFYPDSFGKLIEVRHLIFRLHENELPSSKKIYFGKDRIPPSLQKDFTNLDFRTWISNCIVVYWMQLLIHALVTSLA